MAQDGERSGRDVGDGGPLSRRAFIGVGGAAGAGMVAGGLAPAGALAEPLAGTAALSHKEAARLVADLLSGEAKPPHKRHVVRLTRHLSKPEHGQAVMRRLQKMPDPTRRKARSGASVSSDPQDGDPTDVDFKPPSNTISTHAYWWGYTVFYPHAVFQPIREIINKNTAEQAVKEIIRTYFASVCNENSNAVGCLFRFAIATVTVVSIAALSEIDTKSHGGGAALRAAWPTPTILVPGPF